MGTIMFGANIVQNNKEAPKMMVIYACLLRLKRHMHVDIAMSIATTKAI